jgi:hypothetical protein
MPDPHAPTRARVPVPGCLHGIPGLRPAWWRGPDWAWVVGAALLVRAVALTGWGMIGADSMHFLTMAGQIEAGLVDAAWAHPLRYHPGYPSLIAAVHAILAPLGVGLDASALLLSAAAGVGMVVPVWLLARWAFGDDAGLLAGLLTAFHPELLHLSTDVKTETVFFCLQGAFAVFQARALTARAWGYWAAAGLAAAGALWVRPEGIYAVLVLVAAGAWTVVCGARRGGREATAALARAGLAVALVAVCYSPYVLWIHRTTGRWYFTNKGSAVVTTRAVVESPVLSPERSIEPYRLQKAFGRATLFWILVPLAAAGVAATSRRRAWNVPAVVALSLVALGCAGQVGAHLLIQYAVSPRYFLQGVVFLIPAAGCGAAAAGAWAAARRPALGRVAVVAILAVPVLVSGWKSVDPSRLDRNGLREAGEWILAVYGPGRAVMSDEEQPVHYAKARALVMPRSYGETERAMRESPGRLLVLMDKNFDDLEPGFRAQLDAGPLERVAEFPRAWRPGRCRVWVWRSR